MIYAAPGAAGAIVQFKDHYDNFIGGKWVAPVKGQYFDVITPINGKVYTKAARSSAEDVELALDAAHAAADAWGKTDAASRSNILLKIADRIEANLEMLAYAETVDNGKAIRETLNADIPLTIDHFRYFAGCLRAQEGALSNIDENTVAYHFQEPLGVVGQIIPWNFPILMAAWKLAPAIGAGNCVVLKPAESTPISILLLAELIADLLPAGVLNIVNGYGREAGLPLASSKRIAKIAFTGSTSTGRVIAQAAANNLIPATLELGFHYCRRDAFSADAAAVADLGQVSRLIGATLSALDRPLGYVHVNVPMRLADLGAFESLLNLVHWPDLEVHLGLARDGSQFEAIAAQLTLARQVLPYAAPSPPCGVDPAQVSTLLEQLPRVGDSATAP